MSCYDPAYCPDACRGPAPGGPSLGEGLPEAVFGGRAVSQAFRNMVLDLGVAVLGGAIVVVPMLIMGLGVF